MGGESAKKIWCLFLISLFAIFIGSFMAERAHTDNGRVRVSEITYVSEDGAPLHALLYLPKTATVETPAPAVVAAHGYNNTAELQGINAIELSRRGFVVIVPDEYGHGRSGFPDEGINKGVVADMGVYSAMQYLKRLPYVDVKRVGLVAHSMGGSTIQLAALRAWRQKAMDETVVVPTAVLPTSQAFLLDADKKAALRDFPVNIGVVYGQFDEWADNMWQVPKGSLVNTTERAAQVMGFANPVYGKLYRYGQSSPLSREEAVNAAHEGKFRAMFQPPVVHPRIHMSSEASGYVTDFFSIALLDGKSPLPPDNQIWLNKELATGLSLVGYFVFSVTLGLLLLRMPFFRTLLRSEPCSPSSPRTGSDWCVYGAIYLLCLLPAPLFYNWVTGYPIAIKSMGRAVPTLFPATPLFPMPTANGLVLFNLIIGGIMLAVFMLTYLLYMKRRGAVFADLGIGLPIIQIGKALLLGVLVFLAGYALLAASEAWFGVDFRYYVFSIKTLTPAKIPMFLTYLPFWVFAFVISSLTLNSFTRVQGASEWLNIPLLIVASCGGLFLFWAIDYGALLTAGVKMWTTVPYPEGTTAALAGVLLWGLLFILPISAVIARVFFKATGTIWVGGFINALLVTYFAISNTVIAAGPL